MNNQNGTGMMPRTQPAPLLETVMLAIHGLWCEWFDGLLQFGEVSLDGSVTIPAAKVRQWTLLRRQEIEEMEPAARQELNRQARRAIHLFAPLRRSRAGRDAGLRERARRTGVDALAYRALLDEAADRTMQLLPDLVEQSDADEFKLGYFGYLLQAALESGAFEQVGVEADDIERVAAQLGLTEAEERS